jgi:hypothetical protein
MVPSLRVFHLIFRMYLTQNSRSDFILDLLQYEFICHKVTSSSLRQCHRGNQQRSILDSYATSQFLAHFMRSIRRMYANHKDHSLTVWGPEYSVAGGNYGSQGKCPPSGEADYLLRSPNKKSRASLHTNLLT